VRHYVLTERAARSGAPVLLALAACAACCCLGAGSGEAVVAAGFLAPLGWGAGEPPLCCSRLRRVPCGGGAPPVGWGSRAENREHHQARAGKRAHLHMWVRSMPIGRCSRRGPRLCGRGCVAEAGQQPSGPEDDEERDAAGRGGAAGATERESSGSIRNDHGCFESGVAAAELGRLGDLGSWLPGMQRAPAAEMQRGGSAIAVGRSRLC
jgi:hypothetical protein